MKIVQKDTRLSGEFSAVDEGLEVGRLTYAWAGIDMMIIKHTETNSEVRLQGIGLSLVSAAVDFARIKKIKILPRCSFAKEEFRKHSEWKDVLPQ